MPTADRDLLVWAEVVRNYATTLTFLVALFAGVFGLFRYLRGERIRQTEQVRALYSQFFESDRYRRIRFVLNAPDSPEYAELLADLAQAGIPGPFEGELIDLLNFFEFVTGLARRGLITRSDVDWMFANFIERVTGAPEIRDYILARDYSELAGICRRRLKVRARKAKAA